MTEKVLVRVRRDNRWLDPPLRHSSYGLWLLPRRVCLPLQDRDPVLLGVAVQPHMERSMPGAAAQRRSSDFDGCRPGHSTDLMLVGNRLALEIGPVRDVAVFMLRPCNDSSEIPPYSLSYVMLIKST